MYMSAAEAGRACSSGDCRWPGLAPTMPKWPLTITRRLMQERVGGAAEAVEAQEPARLDGLDDEPDLVEVGADHEPRVLVAAALGGGDVAVAVHVDLVGERAHALLEVLDERLLEAGRAVKRHQVAQRGAERFFRGLAWRLPELVI